MIACCSNRTQEWLSRRYTLSQRLYCFALYGFDPIIVKNVARCSTIYYVRRLDLYIATTQPLILFFYTSNLRLFRFLYFAGRVTCIAVFIAFNLLGKCYVLLLPILVVLGTSTQPPLPTR